MNESGSDIEINKLKLKLKFWELQFQEENGRKPNKDDITKSSDDIQDAYRIYFKMTRSICEKKKIDNSDKKESESSTSSSSSVWNSSLNKISKAESERSKVLNSKLPHGNLEKYANKLQVNANLMQRNSSGLSYISRRSNQRTEKMKKEKEASDNKFNDGSLKEDEEEAAAFSIFSNIKVNDTTKDEKCSKVKSVNLTSVPFANRTVRQSAALCYDSPLSNDDAEKDLLNIENTRSMKQSEEVVSSKLAESSPFRRLDRVSCTIPNSCVDVETAPCLASSNETSILRNDVYEFDEVEKAELNSKVVKRKRNCIEKTSPDSAEVVTRKPQKKRKTEFEHENDISYEESYLDDTNKTLKKNKIQRKKEVEAAISKETQVEGATSKETEVETTTKPRRSRQKKIGVGEGKLSPVKGTTMQKKKRTTKTAAAKYRDAIEAEEAAGFEPSLVSRKPSGTYEGRPSGQRENYVRINLKKKVFSRGHKKFNYKKFKYGQWKQLKQEKPFKLCDDFEDDDLPVSDSETRSQLTSRPKEPFVATNVEVNDFEVDDKVVVAFPGHEVAGPICELIDGNLPSDVEVEVRNALKEFGHSSFRYGQLETIKRVLTGLSTLLIQPTGSGKSLCYLLPAYIYAKRLNAITIVICPLVSLMDDQLAGVPKCLSAACHHTGMTQIQRQKVRESVSAGKVDVLFLSPEALVSGAGSAFGCLPPDMPPIAFVCIDEIHCVSSWSHNFRPSYLRLCRVVRDVLGVSCILGLTATATYVTADHVRQHLGVDQDPMSIIKTDVLPENLHLTVSRDNKEEALLNLLRSEPFLNFNSVIIYCIRREQTERLATIIRTSLQKEASDWTAEAYHAGLSAANRRSVQKRFMSDKLRVVVATVAFGMGLNKPDVRAVIHFNMPKSIESYVQEIGRAGRDGKPAHCHLFLDLRGGDRQELRRHVYANTVDRAAVKKLLSNIFKPCRCKTLKNIEDTLSQESGDCTRPSWKCDGHEVAYVIDDAVEELDIKEEGIDTLLCYLEAHPTRPIKLLNRTYGNCVVFSYGGAMQLSALAEKCPAIAMAFALQKKKTKKTHSVPTNQIEFNLTEVAAMLGQESYQLRRQLMKLKWTTEQINGVVKYRKTNFVVDFKGLAFHLRAVGDLSMDEQDQLTDYLHKRILLQEKTELEQLDKFHTVLHSLSTSQYDSRDELNESRSRQLKETIRCHFQESSVPSVDSIESWTNTITSENIDKVDVICNNIRRFLGIHSDAQFTGRAIARIFHGIESPRYPAKVWGRARQFWRCLLDVDFNTLCKLATREILRN